MDKRQLEEHDVVQIDPGHDANFGGCFMTVSEPKSWGATGFVEVPGKEKGEAYYRCEFANMEYVGKAPFVLSKQ